MQPCFGFETDDWRFSRRWPEYAQPIPQDADPAIITDRAKFFKEPLAGNVGVFLHERPDIVLVRVEFAPSFSPANLTIAEEDIMTAIPQFLMFPDDPSHHVAADVKMPCQRSERPAILHLHDDYLLFEFFSVLDEDRQRGSS